MRRLLPLFLLSSGCTAARVGVQLASAEQAMLRARAEGAEEQARYEYTMALNYLEKAREEAGYSELRIADALARQSAEWSDRAVIFMERRVRADIQLDDFSDAVAPPSGAAPEELEEPARDAGLDLDDELEMDE